MNQDILNSGFIPEVICEQLPGGFEDIELLAEELPKVLANEQITDRVSKLEIEKDISKLSLSELERAMLLYSCLLYTSPSPRDISGSRMPSSA